MHAAIIAVRSTVNLRSLSAIRHPAKVLEPMVTGYIGERGLFGIDDASLHRSTRMFEKYFAFRSENPFNLSHPSQCIHKQQFINLKQFILRK